MSVKDIASRLHARGFSKLTMLPYNWRYPENTRRWWLSPSKDKIAYPYGKITVTSNEDWIDADRVFIGFNVEKGIASAQIKGDSVVMKSNWFWHQFVKNAETPLKQAIEKSRSSTALPIFIVMMCGVEVGSSELPIPGDIVRFDCIENKLVPHVLKEEDGSLAELSKVTEYAEFAAVLRKLPPEKFDWRWCDCLIGSYFTANSFDEVDADSAIEMLSPFESWIR